MSGQLPRKRIWSFWAVGVSLAVLLAVGCFTLLSQTSYWITPPFAEGYALAQSGNWPGTAELARQRLKRDPKDPDALLLLARASVRLGRPETAAGVYSQLGTERLESEDRVWLATQLLDKGQKTIALSLLEIADPTKPESPEALQLLARLKADDGRLAEALPVAQKLTQFPGWEGKGWLLTGEIYEKISDPLAAAHAFGKALMFNTEKTGNSTSDLRARQARSLMQAGRFDEAEEVVRVGVGNEGPSPAIAWLLSRILLNQGNRTGAGEMLELAKNQQTHPLEFDPSPYAGSITCKGCHSQIYQTQQASHHSTTFSTAKALGKVAGTEKPLPDSANPGITYEVLHTDADTLQLTATRDGKTAQAVGKFAFGSDDRGQTVVGPDTAGNLREFRISHFSEHQGWDLTIGHPSVPSGQTGLDGSPIEFLGEILPEDSVRLCFGCHTTNARAAREGLPPTASDHAIGCETCHGPSATHIKAMNAAPTFPDVALARPRLASGPETVKLCGRCHSPAGREVSPLDPTSVRFQATTLTWSACYKKSQGALSCLSCHNPHTDAVTSPAYYEQKCLECHAEPGKGDMKPQGPDGTRSIQLADEVKRVVCPVNPANSCISCHMPEKRDAIPHTKFTDHHIRVHPGSR